MNYIDQLIIIPSKQINMSGPKQHIDQIFANITSGKMDVTMLDNNFDYAGFAPADAVKVIKQLSLALLAQQKMVVPCGVAQKLHGALKTFADNFDAADPTKSDVSGVLVPVAEFAKNFNTAKPVDLRPIHTFAQKAEVTMKAVHTAVVAFGSSTKDATAIDIFVNAAFQAGNATHVVITPAATIQANTVAAIKAQFATEIAKIANVTTADAALGTMATFAGCTAPAPLAVAAPAASITKTDIKLTEMSRCNQVFAVMSTAVCDWDVAEAFLDESGWGSLKTAAPGYNFI